MKMTAEQLKFLQDNSKQIWEIFIESDDGLRDSTCECCEEKRKLMKLFDDLGVRPAAAAIH